MKARTSTSASSSRAASLESWRATVTNNASAIVPDVLNELEATASEKIVAAGFVPKFHFPQEHAAEPAIIISVQSQSPLGGSSAPLGSTVTLTMSVRTVP